MARHKTFLSTRQESMQRTVHDTRKRNGQIMEHKTEELIALPPVRATTSSDHQPENRHLSPLSKWQIQRCSSPNPGNCQEELVNEWLHRNHIRVVQRLPKMDPIVLTSRGADVSKYISFISPPPFTLKVLSTEDRRSRENTHRTTVSASEPATPCPRLLRSQRSDREMFPLNPVIRVGGGYRRLSWKVLDVLPSIGQYDPDFSPDYRCSSCNAILPVTEKVTNSRGQLRTILATPKTCHKCGTPTTDYQALTENDLHESVQDTLHRGDSRFIVDHRRFYNSRDSRSRPKKNERVSPASSSPMDWHEDMESFRIHMSRQSYQDDDLETKDQASEQKRSESGSGVFITEPGEDINNINEPPDVRRAWDDGSASADVTREYGNTSGDWGKAKETGSGLSDNDNDSFDDFEMIEDYDPESGFTVLLRRRPFGGTQQNSYLIHGVQDEEGTGKKGRKHGHRDEKTVRKEYETGHSRKKANKHISADQKANRQILHDINGNEDELNNEEQKENRTNRRAKNLKHSFPRTDSFYAVGLDRRDYVFSEEPILQETDEDSVMIDPRTRFSENSLSDIEFDADSWSPGPLVNGAMSRPSVPSPVDQDYADYSSSLSISPEQHDGYLADSEENADLSSLQAQIQQARNDAKKNQRRREEGKETRRKESKGRKEKATEDSLPQNPPDEDGSNRAPLNSGEWDSDWDSDFSLHVQPLSDLSESSSEDEPWENGTQRRTNNLESQERSRKVSDKTTANVSRRKGSRPNDTDLHKGAVNGGADREGARRSSAGETRVRDRKSSRHTIVKPIPKIGSGSDSEDAIPRPRLRAPHDEDDLSESDLSFFSQQFQAPYPTKGQEIGPTDEGPVGCKGINCYRCGAFIPECQGVCAKCGTLCQRPGGPCNACRDICESCGKPRYKCTSAEKRLKASEEEKREEKDIDSDDLEAEPIIERDSKRTSRDNGEDHGSVQVSVDKIGVDRKGSGTMIGDELNNAEQNFQKKRERKNRAPTERKRKDVNKIKRVRTKRNQNSLDDEEHESENELVNGVDEVKDALEIEKLETHRESAETILIEELPSKPEPSAYSNKSTKKTKPSKKVISQTVLYKEKEKPSKTKRTSLQEETNSRDTDSVVTSPTPSVETVESGEETLPTEREGTGEEVRSTEQRVGDESVVDENNVSDDVINKPEEGEKAGNEEKMAEEKEKEEQRQMELEEKKRNVIPKIRGVMRVNAAFKDRVELAKRLQSVLKKNHKVETRENEIQIAEPIAHHTGALAASSLYFALESVREAISDVIGQADIKTRKDSTIDYLAQYRLVERSHLEMYGRAFTLEDGDEDGIISYEQMLLALEGVPSIAGMSRKQLLFVLQVLELFPGSRITFKMFSVMTALCEKVTVLDAFVKQLMEELNLFDLECKLDMFRNMFFVTGDYSVNFITADQLRIELKAGGLNQQQEDHVIGHVLQSTQPGEISFLDYMAYLPLFLSIHQNICDNALDMSRNKYQRSDTT